MTPIQIKSAAARACLGLLFVAVLMAGCARNDDGNSFTSAEAAVAALADALQKDDTAKLQQLLGTGSADLLSSGDAVQDRSDRAQFLAAYQRSHKLVAGDGDSMMLVVGEREWPVPIPVVKRDGRWVFDAEKGADELVYLRIGANELGAINVCRGFVDAQLEYAAGGRDGDSAGIYALKLISDDDLRNGLYWATAEGESPSPAGPFVAAAAAEGYRAAGTRAPYHGYYYRMLYKQGANANGGAREYFRNGLLTEGFALVAWPADYQVSGVMTFIVNQDGVVFQKDLGEGTEAAVAAMTAFDPDSTWVAVTEPSGT